MSIEVLLVPPSRLAQLHDITVPLMLHCLVSWSAQVLTKPDLTCVIRVSHVP